jgi:L-ascorbate 6-phosphate lactonase
MSEYNSNKIQEQSSGPVLTYLGQAGFLVQGKDISIVIDPYLSDCVEREIGFKRMQPPVVSPEDLTPDVMLNTHSHMDHLDIDVLQVFAAREKMLFIGATDCEEVYKNSAITEKRYKILREGERTQIGEAVFQAVYADHGELAPEAVGFLIKINGVTIYNVGDSGLATELILKSLGNEKINVMIAPINGAYGNLDEIEACSLACAVQPDVLIASHFWMFVEHGGDPAAFLVEAKRLGLNGIVMAPGESYPIRGENKHD